MTLGAGRNPPAAAVASRGGGRHALPSLRTRRGASRRGRTRPLDRLLYGRGNTFVIIDEVAESSVREPKGMSAALADHADRLVAVFGEWPCFHDAEVMRVVLDRGAGRDGPTLAMDIEIELPRPAGEVAADSAVRRHHALVTLRFSGVALLTLAGFNHQNVLWDLEMAEIDPALNEGRRLRIDMPTSHGMEAAFECRQCDVVSVQPRNASA